MTDLEKQIIDRLNKAISSERYQLTVKNDIIHMYSTSKYWNGFTVYKWHTIDDMLSFTNNSRFSLFDFVECYHLRSCSFEELCIKLDLLGV